MNREELIERITTVFRSVFEDPDLIISEGTKPEDVENWDSIGHMYLVYELEDEFGIEFDERVHEVSRVADLVDLIIEKL